MKIMTRTKEETKSKKETKTKEAKTSKETKMETETKKKMRGDKDEELMIRKEACDSVRMLRDELESEIEGES